MDTNSYNDALNTLTAAADAYYHSDELLLTDAEYDALFREVVAYETEHGLTSPVTSSVAAGTQSAGADVAHATPMLSLDNAMAGTDDLQRWSERLDGNTGFVVEPKLDGLAASVVYENGRLVHVATRGDGRTGEDVTAAASACVGIPTELSEPVTIEIRGEIVLTEADLQVANELRERHGDRPFANARNGAAGALRGAAGRSYSIPMSFGAYAVVGGEYATHIDAMTAVSAMGVMTARELCGLTHSDFVDIAAVQDEIDAIEHLRFHPETPLPVAIDGAVVKINSTEAFESLGNTSHSPRGAIAYKYPAQEVRTTLREIRIQVGRTGVLTPVAVLDPVDVAGVIVEHANVSNPQVVAQKGLRVGADVIVRRAGDVIPEITGVIRDETYDNAEDWIPPSTCPNCGDTIDKSSVRWRCASLGECATTTAIAYFASRKCMDIEGLSSRRIELFVDAGLIGDPADLYSLTVDDIARLDRMGELSATSLIDQIDRSRQQPLDRLLTSLNVKDLGTTLSRRITAVHQTLDDVLALSVDDLACIDGVGGVRAEVIANGLKKRRPLIDRLVAAGVRTDADVVETVADAPLAGKRVCVSGTVPGLTREEAKMAVEQLGGIPASSVSKSTDLLVAGAGAGSKLAKAESLGVDVMDADDFAQLVAASVG